MSNVKIQGNPSGSGTFTIASPNSNSDVTINLPAVTGGDFIVSDSSGNVGIGTSSPSVRLSLGSSTPAGTASKLRLFDDGAAETSTTSNSYGFGISAAGQFSYTAGTSGSHAWFTANAERMRIDSAGNVGIGTSSPLARMQVSTAGTSTTPSTNTVARFVTNGSNADSHIQISNGVNSSANIGIAGGANLYFATDGVERMRIASDGRLSVGLTGSINGNTSYSFENNSAVLNTVWFHNASTSDGTTRLVLTTARAATTAFNFIDCGANYPTSFARQFLVTGAGVVWAQNTAIQSLSDARVKENIRDSSEGLQTIMGVRPVRFDFKDGFGNNRKNVLGFVAQEIETVFPDAVDTSPIDPDGEGPEEPYKSVGPAALIPVLVKAIQELNAKVDAQAAEIAALKGATE